MADTSILSDFGINILEEEIDDVIFQTNEFLCDATFTGSQGPFWWILQMCMALAVTRSILVDPTDVYGTCSTILHNSGIEYGLQDDGEA